MSTEQRHSGIIPLALFNANIEFNAYQYDPFFEFFEWSKKDKKWIPKVQGLLIADEVGVGKTIEAGIIIKEFLKNKKDARILIVVPNALLCSQWRQQLSRLFCIDFYDYRNQKCDNFKNFPRVICSKEEISDLHSKEWDLLIIDEAHIYRNKNNNYDDLKKLRKKSKYVIGMSATFKVNTDEDIETIKSMIIQDKQVPIISNKKHEVFCLNTFPEIKDVYVNMSKKEKDFHDEIKEKIGSHVIYKQMLVSSLQNFHSVINSEELKEIRELEEIDELGEEENTDVKNENEFPRIVNEKDSKLEKINTKHLLKIYKCDIIKKWKI